MIGRLTGTIIDRGPDGAAIIDVNGVGYEVFVPYGLGLGIEDVSTHTLFVHTHVREDALVLFGFASNRDRAAFRSLLTVSGVGPKVALAILGTLDADQLLAAVQQGNGAAFKGITGVGKKTTDRILLDLRDKLESVLGPATSKSAAVPAKRQGPAPQGNAAAAVQALTQLGYRPHEAEAAVAQLPDTDDQPLEAILRDALALMG